MKEKSEVNVNGTHGSKEDDHIVISDYDGRGAAENSEDNELCHQQQHQFAKAQLLERSQYDMSVSTI